MCSRCRVVWCSSTCLTSRAGFGAWRSAERDEVRKIAMGYEAASFGGDVSPRFNIVVRRVVGCAMVLWEADACRCVRQSTARWLLPVSRDIYGPATTSKVDQCHCNGGSRRPRSRCMASASTRRAWRPGRHAVATANHGLQATIGWRSTVSITSCASRGSRPLHSDKRSDLLRGHPADLACMNSQVTRRGVGSGC